MTVNNEQGAKSSGTDQQQQPVPVTGEGMEGRNWGMLCHLSGLAVWLGMPFGNIIGPLIVWLMKKDQYPEVDVQGKEALNFQLSWTIYTIVAGLMVLMVIGLLILPLLFIAHLVLTILAALEVSKGRSYRYPLTIRFFT